MRLNRKYLVAVALLAAFAVVFGLAGTLAPGSELVSPQSSSSSSSSDSVTHFVNPPTYDSNWTDIRNKTGQYFTLMHGLNTTEAVVDIRGKQSLDPECGALAWGRTFGGSSNDYGHSVVQTFDGGYAVGGVTKSFGDILGDGWLVKFDSAGTVQWNTTYGGADNDQGWSLVQTLDGGYALSGYTNSFGAVFGDGWLVKVNAEMNLEHQRNLGTETGLTCAALTNTTITFYRGSGDPYWNYLRVRIWIIKEPTWMFGDINMDGVVDAEDLLILSRNYGKTFSALSLTGIIAVTGVHAYKKRKKQPA